MGRKVLINLEISDANSSRIKFPRSVPALVRDEELSVGIASENLIVHGDNNRALTELQSQLEGRVECIYIDPPYNNNEKYHHYDDRDGFDEWSEKIFAHLEALPDLLTETGSVWISIDDRQLHYLKVYCDAVFGRENFVGTMVWEHRKSRENRKVFSFNHEYILVYARDVTRFRKRRNLLADNGDVVARFKNPDGDSRGSWQSVSANVQAGHAVPSQFYSIIAPNGKAHVPPRGRCWVYAEERMKQEIAANNVWFGSDGNGVPRLKRFLRDRTQGLTPHTLWRADEVGTTDDAKKHLMRAFPEQPIFDTPKPERLIQRILEIATDSGDLVLDSFLGSGTTAAVAHIMGRKFVGIERGDHAISYCAQRLRRIVAGDKAISTLSNWKGGGDFSVLRFGNI